MLRNWRQTNLNLEEFNYLNNITYSTDLSNLKKKCTHLISELEKNNDLKYYH